MLVRLPSNILTALQTAFEKNLQIKYNGKERKVTVEEVRRVGNNTLVIGQQFEAVDPKDNGYRSFSLNKIEAIQEL